MKDLASKLINAIEPALDLMDDNHYAIQSDHLSVVVEEVVKQLRGLEDENIYLKEQLNTTKRSL